MELTLSWNCFIITLAHWVEFIIVRLQRKMCLKFHILRKTLRIGLILAFGRYVRNLCPSRLNIFCSFECVYLFFGFVSIRIVSYDVWYYLVLFGTFGMWHQVVSTERESLVQTYFFVWSLIFVNPDSCIRLQNVCELLQIDAVRK